MDQPKVFRIFTIGYERRPISEFIELLSENRIEIIIDVRANPYSRNRDYSLKNLESHLLKADIKYYHFPSLGSPGHIREKLKQDHDYGSFNQLYRGYLSTQSNALDDLYNLLLNNVLCLLCLEQNPNFCHRTLIAEKLKEMTSDQDRIEIINL